MHLRSGLRSAEESDVAERLAMNGAVEDFSERV